MSGLFLPRKQAQMSKAIVFWFNRSADFIMCPPSPVAPAPAGFEKIECRHAAQVDMWSRRLRRQEKRIREMTDVERFEFEGKVQSGIIEEMKKCLANATDQVNREFLSYFIKKAEEKRSARRMEVVETFMHVEAKEGVAP
jgi:hypothetical protein